VTTDRPAVVAIGVFLAYMVLVGVIWQVTGTRYDALVDSRAHVLRGIVLPIGLGALLLAVVTTWLGWWNSALFEGSRSGPAWALVARRWAPRRQGTVRARRACRCAGGAACGGVLRGLLRGGRRSSWAPFGSLAGRGLQMIAQPGD